MEKSEIEQIVKKYIQNNLKIAIREESSRSECSYHEEVYVDLILDGEIISSQEIQKLGENY